jgi:hypothetical protein
VEERRNADGDRSKKCKNTTDEQSQGHAISRRQPHCPAAQIRAIGSKQSRNSSTRVSSGRIVHVLASTHLILVNKPRSRQSFPHALRRAADRYQPRISSTVA